MRATRSTDATNCGARFDPPRPAHGLALRSTVLEHPSEPTVRVAVITAPAGYGKTSHAAAFAGRQQRPVAWIDVETQLDDAPSLLTDLVAALDEITALDRTGLIAAGLSSAQ